ANVFACPIVDLSTGFLDNAEHEHDLAARLELMAHEAHAFEVQALALVRRQKPPPAQVANVTRARRIRSKLKVLAVWGEFVQTNVEIKILLVRHKLESSGEQTTQLGSNR